MVLGTNGEIRGGSTPSESTIFMKEEKYYHDYPNEPIGGGNPYYRCFYCKISDPQINGQIDNHLDSCEYRIKKNEQLQQNLHPN